MQKMKNISEVTTLFIPTLMGGGAERVTIMIANGLADEGKPVDLVVGNANGPYGDLISKNVNVVDFKTSRLLFALPQYSKYLFQRKPRLVLSSLGHANVATVILAKLITPKTKTVISIHNSLKTPSEKKNFAPFYQIVKRLHSTIVNQADHIITVSQGIRTQILDLYRISPSKVTAIYNPLDVKHIEKMSTQNAGHGWLDDGSLPVIIGVGRLTEQKNFDLLIRAFSKVKEEVPSRLVILGEGEDRELLERRVQELQLSDNVLMPGFVDNPFAWIQKSTVFAMSSGWEGLPGVLLEALACGTQVVSTDCETGPYEILEGGKWGKLVGVGDRDGLSQAIIEVLQQRESVDTKLRALDFDKEHSVAHYTEVLNRVAYTQYPS